MFMLLRVLKTFSYLNMRSNFFHSYICFCLDFSPYLDCINYGTELNRKHIYIKFCHGNNTKTYCIKKITNTNNPNPNPKQSNSGTIPLKNTLDCMMIQNRIQPVTLLYLVITTPMFDKLICVSPTLNRQSPQSQK